MKRALLLPAALLLGCGLAQAADDKCRPAPLGDRPLYLRGTLNNWQAEEEQQFRYACNRYELVLKLEGEHSFKIGDEDWSPDADFGGPDAAALRLKGEALQRRFEPGIHCLILRMPASAGGGAPALDIQACPGRQPTAQLPPPPAHPLAAGLRFDSRQPRHKSPFGAVPAGSLVRFAIDAPAEVKAATLVIESRRLEGNQEVLSYQPLARVSMRPRPGGWVAEQRFGAPAVYGYYFELQTADGQPLVLHNNRDTIYWTREKGSMGAGQAEAMPSSAKRIRRYRQTVHAPDFKVPAWARDAIYYYVFPERFRNGDKRNDPQPRRDRYHDQTVEAHPRWLDKPYKPGSGDGSDAVYNNDFFGGDLAGLIEKLDYIKALGANTLYLTPVFKAASNHKYDSADYHRIDPAFGSNADFERLCAEAAKRGIRVIPDTSLNHVGQDSPYFNRFMNYPAGGAFDGGKINAGSLYADWFSFDPSKTQPEDQYKGWVGVADLPELNKASPSFRAFAYGDRDSVTKRWLDRGAAGWRMDVAPWVPDDFWREWRRAVKGHKPDALTVAETWFDASKFLLGDMFDSTMNYIFRNTLLDYAAGGDAKKLYANIELMREAYPRPAFYALMNLLSSHDQARALHHFGYRDESKDAAKLPEAKQRLRLAMLFQMVFPGSPAIYYGDEVGLAGGDDPYNRAPYPWADEGGQPDQQLLADVQRLTRLRQQQPVLRHGSLDAPLYLDSEVIVLLRQDGRRWALTATSNHAREPRRIRLKLPPALHGAQWRDALPQAGRAPSPIIKPDSTGHLTLEIPALSGRVLLWH